DRERRAGAARGAGDAARRGRDRPAPSGRDVTWLLWLYPPAWRRRYGAELAALVEELGPSPRVVADALLGALRAHLEPAPASRSRSTRTRSPASGTSPFVSSGRPARRCPGSRSGGRSRPSARSWT